MNTIRRALQYTGNVCISGLTASGKTTHAHLLAGEFGLTYVSGSQIQLNFMGISPVQSREFWVTQEAKALWDREQFARIDAELLRLEYVRTGCIFDTSTMPWRHRKDALCIWLESNIDSRVVKSIISHHGNGDLDFDKYPALIAEKDRMTISLYRDLYGIEIGSDLSPFDLTLDISGLIREPSLEAALASIWKAHSVIRAASAFYLTGKSIFRDDYLKAVADASDIIKLDAVLDARERIANGR
jgi:cytidylate kinase